MRKPYPTDTSDAQWAYLEAHLPSPKTANGRPRTYPLREIVDAVFYVVKSGCAWRLLPHDFPPWKTVYHYFRMAHRRHLGKVVRRPTRAGVSPYG